MSNVNGSAIDEHEERWDVVVIGAGPAGSLAACLSARMSFRTLLVEQHRFPRDKVCGGCVNGQAIATLLELGIGDIAAELPVSHIDAIHLHSGPRSATLALCPGVALSRSTLDAWMVSKARMAGVEFRDGVAAAVQPMRRHDARRRIELRDDSGRGRVVAARIVLVADGLGQPSLRRLPEFRVRVARDSRIGLAAFCPKGPGANVAGITMVIGKYGYVGAVQLPGGHWNLAAAVDPASVRRWGVVGSIQEILLPNDDLATVLESATWQGTRPLTCRATRVAGERLFVLGDAQGYVEPFTGEGIAWALASASEAAPIVRAACEGWRDDYAHAWQRKHDKRQRTRRLCRCLSWLVRRPTLAGCLITLLGSYPRVARPVTHRIGRPDWENNREVHTCRC